MEEQWLLWITGTLDWIRSAGWVGMVWFVVLFALTCVFFLPGSALTVGAGAVYGFWWGTLLVMLGSVLGAQINFFTSRYLLRDWISRKLRGRPRLLALDRAIERKGWQVVFVSRLSPIVPHSLVSYIAGLTGIGVWRFSIASLVGFLPISAAYSYGGALLGAVARTRANITSNDPLSWALYILGLFVSVFVVVWTARIAAKALHESAPEEF